LFHAPPTPTTTFLPLTSGDGDGAHTYTTHTTHACHHPGLTTLRATGRSPHSARLRKTRVAACARSCHAETFSRHGARALTTMPVLFLPTTFLLPRFPTESLIAKLQPLLQQLLLFPQLLHTHLRADSLTQTSEGLRLLLPSIRRLLTLPSSTSRLPPQAGHGPFYTLKDHVAGKTLPAWTGRRTHRHSGARMKGDGRH